MTDLAIPDELTPYAGRIIDVDTHEMMPIQAWTQEFGDVARELVELYASKRSPGSKFANNQNVPSFLADDTEINADTVWNLKGPLAPASTDMTRREAVLDLVGVRRQLMFSTSLGLFGALLCSSSNTGLWQPPDGMDIYTYAKELFKAHNEWVVRVQQLSKRFVPLAFVQGDDVDEVYTIAADLVRRGVRGIQLIQTQLLGGVSPAHEDHDRLWSLLADHNVSVNLHTGPISDFFGTVGWQDAQAFDGYRKGVEFDLNPWSMSVTHLPCQNYVATLVLGGVFERHPSLRFGAIEVGAFWIGPLAHQLDMWHEIGGQFRITKGLVSEKPSTYIRRNVRVAPFDFERVDEYIDLYGFDEMYCFASDYPHVEGGREPMTVFANQLQRFGPEMLEKFFVTNGEFLVPG